MPPEQISIEEEIRNSMNAALDEAEDSPAEDEPDAEAPESTMEEPPVDVLEEVKPQPHDEPPVSLSAAAKAKWKELPDDMRAEWHKRESDMHKAMTAKDGDLNLGRTIKEIAQPYEAIIRSEGGTVEGAFKDLMNTAYILRTGSPQQKAHLILQTAEQFGVDLRPYIGGNVQQQPNQLSALQQEIAYLRNQQVNPEQIKQQLQEEMQGDKIRSEIQAFASDPANVHFESVKPIMGALIQSGKAKDLKEAYQMAIWSDPSIRAQLEAEAKAQADEKRKSEMAAKKKASASVTGSASAASPNANAPQKTIEQELRDSLRATQGKI